MEYRENAEAEGPYRYWMTCLSGAGLGNRSKRQLLDCYKSPSAVYRARKEELDKLGFLRQREVDAFIFQRGSWDLREEYERFLEADMGLVTLDMEGYPANLRMLLPGKNPLRGERRIFQAGRGRRLQNAVCVRKEGGRRPVCHTD